MVFAQKSLSVFRVSLLIYVFQVPAGAVIARLLGPTTLGFWFILLLIPTYAEVFGRLMFDTAAVYYLGKGKYRFSEVAFTLNVVTLCSAGAIIVLLLLSKGWLFSTFLHDLTHVGLYFYLMLAYIPISFFTINYRYLLLAQGDIAGYNMILLISTFLEPLLVILLLIGTNLRLEALVAMHLAVGMLGLVYGVTRVHRGEPLTPNTNLKMIRDLWSFGSKLYLISIFSHLNTYVSGVLIVPYLSAGSVAFYQMAQSRALLLGKLPEAVGTVLFPRVAQTDEGDTSAANLTVRSIRISLLLLLPAMVLGCALAKPIVLLLYGKSFEPMIIPLWILLPGVVLFASTGLIAQYLTGRGRLKTIMLITVVPMVLQVGLLSVAVPRFGIIGAALATSLTYVVSSLIHLTVFSRIENISVVEMLSIDKQDIAFVLSFCRQRIEKVLIAIKGQMSFFLLTPKA